MAAVNIPDTSFKADDGPETGVKVIVVKTPEGGSKRYVNTTPEEVERVNNDPDGDYFVMSCGIGCLDPAREDITYYICTKPGRSHFTPGPDDIPIYFI